MRPGHSRVTLALLAATAACAGGCNAVKPCRPGSVLVEYELAGSAAVQQLVVVTTINGTQKRTPTPASTGHGTVELEFPDGYQAGATVDVALSLFGSDPTIAVGRGRATVTLARGCSHVVIPLTSCANSPAATDFYADLAGGQADGSGSVACPSSSIAVALAAAKASGATAKIVHIAAGRYDAEPLPLIVEGGVSLVGAGPDVTVIQGAGLVPTADNEGRSGTLRIGDGNANRVAQLTLQPPAIVTSSEAGVRVVGVQCDGGNLTSVGLAGDPRFYPAPNSVLDNVVIGPNYEVGVILDNAGEQSLGGCNLSLTNSTVTGNYAGVVASPCGARGLATAVSLGDASHAGNDTISAATNQTACGVSTSGLTCGDSGVGVFVDQSCLRLARIFGSRFDDDDYGVHVKNEVNTIGNTFVDIENNLFTANRHGGLFASDAAVIDLFISNEITGGVGPIQGNYAAVGIGLFQGSTLYRARHNSITDVDCGVDIGDDAIVPGAVPDRSRIDFGTPADPGLNWIACNSQPPDVSYDGYGDVLLDINDPMNVTSTAGLSFAGNYWDHIPPTAAIQDGTPPGGTDVSDTSSAPQRPIDVSGAMLYTGACPSRRMR